MFDGESTNLMFDIRRAEDKWDVSHLLGPEYIVILISLDERIGNVS